VDPDPSDLLARFGSPLYVYDAEVIRARCRELRAFAAALEADLHYAMKANSNPEILRLVGAEGLGVDAVSLGEARAALAAGFPPERIALNGNNLPSSEMDAIFGLGVHQSVDSLSALDRFGLRHPGAALGIRLNPEIGAGHHAHVVTGGSRSKFGIDPADIPEVHRLARRHRLRIDGLQHHIGSGILDASVFLEAMAVLLEASRGFPDLVFVDFGGGFGVPYRPGDPRLDLGALAARAGPILAESRRTRPAGFRYRFEPGRFVVAESGTLLVTVTAVKHGRLRTFVGTDSGFHHLLRPMAYGSFHAIENQTRPSAPLEPVAVAGLLCESGDLFAEERLLPAPREGDVLAIRTAGAYGWSMSSNYNLRPRPAEVMVEDGRARLIRRAETVEDLLGP
jgi:diaminopimelate decarboxylase